MILFLTPYPSGGSCLSGKCLNSWPFFAEKPTLLLNLQLTRSPVLDMIPKFPCPFSAREPGLRDLDGAGRRRFPRAAVPADVIINEKVPSSMVKRGYKREGSG